MNSQINYCDHFKPACRYRIPYWAYSAKSFRHKIPKVCTKKDESEPQKRTGTHQLRLPGSGRVGLGGRVQGQPLLPGVRYLSTVTLPLRTGRESTGSDTRMGLNWNLQPKQRAESLKKDTDTIGRSKMWMGSTWETMQPPGW